MKNMQKYVKNPRAGFTMIEILIAIAIIAILAAVSVPVVGGFVRSGRQANRENFARTIYLSVQNQLINSHLEGNKSEGLLNRGLSGNLVAEALKNNGAPHTGELAIGGPSVICCTEGPPTCNACVDADPNFCDKYNPDCEGLPDCENCIPESSFGNNWFNVRYISKPMDYYIGFDWSTINPFITPEEIAEVDNFYLLLKATVTDSSLIHNAILIEYNYWSGIVLSIIIGDTPEHNYLRYMYVDFNDPNNVTGPRGDDYYNIAASRRQGFFGVDETGVPFWGEDEGRDSAAIFDGAEEGRALDGYVNILYAVYNLVSGEDIYSFDVINTSGTRVVGIEDVNRNDFPANLDDALAAAIAPTAPVYGRHVIYREGDEVFWVLDFVHGNMTDPNNKAHSIKERYGSNIPLPVDLRARSFRGGTDAPPVTSLTSANSHFASRLPGNFYDIRSARHLNNIRNVPMSTKYRQTADIEMSPITNFEPIGGIFTGEYFASKKAYENFEIRNLTINVSANAGLFVRNDGTIQNLTITGANVTTANGGGILAMHNRKTIKGVRIEGVINGSGGDIGGIVGRNGWQSGSDGVIEDSIVSVTISANGATNVGGIAGLNFWRIYFSGAEESKVSGNGAVGGIAGRNQGRVQDVYFLSTEGESDGKTAAPVVSGANSGGIVGNNIGRVHQAMFLAYAERRVVETDTVIYPIVHTGNNATGSFYLGGFRYRIKDNESNPSPWVDGDYNAYTEPPALEVLGGGDLGLTDFLNTSWINYVYSGCPTCEPYPCVCPDVPPAGEPCLSCGLAYDPEDPCDCEIDAPGDNCRWCSENPCECPPGYVGFSHWRQSDCGVYPYPVLKTLPVPENWPRTDNALRGDQVRRDDFLIPPSENEIKLRNARVDFINGDFNDPISYNSVDYLLNQPNPSQEGAVTPDSTNPERWFIPSPMPTDNNDNTDRYISYDPSRDPPGAFPPTTNINIAAASRDRRTLSGYPFILTKWHNRGVSPSHNWGGFFAYYRQQNVYGWMTRPVDPIDLSNPYYGAIEFQRRSLTAGNNRARNTYNGNANQAYAELNADVPGTLYQKATTQPNQRFYYSFHHQARTNGTATERMSFYLTGSDDWTDPGGMHAGFDDLTLIRPCRSPRSQPASAPAGTELFNSRRYNPNAAQTVNYTFSYHSRNHPTDPHDIFHNVALRRYWESSREFNCIGCHGVSLSLRTTNGCTNRSGAAICANWSNNIFIYDVWIGDPGTGDGNRAASGYGVTFWSHRNFGGGGGNPPALALNGYMTLSELYSAAPEAEHNVFGYWNVAFGWKRYYGFYEVPAEQGSETEFAFQSNMSNAREGNYLAGVEFKAPAFLKIDTNVKRGPVADTAVATRFANADEYLWVEIIVDNQGEVAAENIVVECQLAPYHAYFDFVPGVTAVTTGTGVTFNAATVTAPSDSNQQTLRVPLSGQLRDGEKVIIRFRIRTKPLNPGTLFPFFYFFEKQATVSYREADFRNPHREANDVFKSDWNISVFPHNVRRVTCTECSPVSPCLNIDCDEYSPCGFMCTPDTPCGRPDCNENHLLRLNDIGFKHERPNGNGTVNIVLESAFPEDRVIYAWTDLSGAANEVNNVSFATDANRTAFKVRTVFMPAGSTFAQIDLPSNLLYDTTTNKIANTIYIIVATSGTDANEIANNRGGGTDNEFERIERAILTVLVTPMSASPVIRVDISPVELVTEIQTIGVFADDPLVNGPFRVTHTIINTEPASGDTTWVRKGAVFLPEPSNFRISNVRVNGTPVRFNPTFIGGQRRLVIENIPDLPSGQSATVTYDLTYRGGHPYNYGVVLTPVADFAYIYDRSGRRNITTPVPRRPLGISFRALEDNFSGISGAANVPIVLNVRDNDSKNHFSSVYSMTPPNYVLCDAYGNVFIPDTDPGSLSNAPWSINMLDSYVETADYVAVIPRTGNDIVFFPKNAITTADSFVLYYKVIDAFATSHTETPSVFNLNSQPTKVQIN